MSAPSTADYGTPSAPLDRMVPYLTPALTEVLHCAIRVADQANDKTLSDLRTAVESFIGTIATAPEIFWRRVPPNDGSRATP